MSQYLLAFGSESRVKTVEVVVEKRTTRSSDIGAVHVIEMSNCVEYEGITNHRTISRSP